MAIPQSLHSSVPELPEWIELRSDGIHSMLDVQAALSKSGTISLELAVMGVPHLVAHQVSPITYQIAKRVIKGVHNIALPNILSGKEVIPEFIQDLNPVELAQKILSLPEHQNVDLSALGEGGASQRAARLISEFCSAQPESSILE